MYPEIEVEISNTQGHLQVDLANLDRLVRIVLAAEDRPRGSISIALVDDATIQTINRRHLGHDWPTDVITFPLNGHDDPVLAGELVVSAEMACTTARELGVEPNDELALYVVHGLLHLCGFDDQDDAERKRMRQREQELLSQAGLRNHDTFATAALSVLTDTRADDPPPVPSGDCAGAPRLASDRREGMPWTA